MKLKNSVQALKAIVDKAIKDKGIDGVRATYKNVSHIECQDTAFLWLIWWNLSQQVRRDLIELSIPESDWVGGYPDHTDAQLQTLLKKAINLDWIRNV